MNANILLKIKESLSETHLVERCIELMKIYNQDDLLKMASNMQNFNYLFLSLYLNKQEIDYVLLKRYYLSNNHNTIDNNFDLLIEQGRFNEVDDIIMKHHPVRIKLLEHFLTTVNSDNLSRINRNLTDKEYNKMDIILEKMQEYYQAKSLEAFIVKKKIYSN